MSDCTEISDFFLLRPDDEFIVVRCIAFREYNSLKLSTVIYNNAHAIIRSKESVKKKLSQGSKEKLNVLMVGIDSMSRLNLIRAMPNTYKHLEDEGWFELRGYNKIAENTFPNLMAVLTGQDIDTSRELCDWRYSGGLEKCPFIWKDFDAANYVTAYAEDEAFTSTFNYYSTGFIAEPTDYYFRPFGLAAESEIHTGTLYDMTVCLGYQHYADHILKYALEFTEKCKNGSSFGLFWLNSFSHEDLSFPSSMDTRIVFYLQKLKSEGVLDSSIVIFFSDHGMRFGKMRRYYTGWLEERLPFFFMWLPEKFKRENPTIVENLRINRDRLSSPYDVHITLQDILKMSDGYNESYRPSAVSCPTCQSLFAEIAINRSCSDAGISKHWCTCTLFEEIDEKSETVELAVNHALQHVNSMFALHPNCAMLHLNEIISARAYSNKSMKLLISFSVKPSEAEFEALVKTDHQFKNFEIVGSISRINRYENQSWCISDDELRKFCFCELKLIN